LLGKASQTARWSSLLARVTADYQEFWWVTTQQGGNQDIPVNRFLIFECIPNTLGQFFCYAPLAWEHVLSQFLNKCELVTELLDLLSPKMTFSISICCVAQHIKISWYLGLFKSEPSEAKERPSQIGGPVKVLHCAIVRHNKNAQVMLVICLLIRHNAKCNFIWIKDKDIIILAAEIWFWKVLELSISTKMLFRILGFKDLLENWRRMHYWSFLIEDTFHELCKILALIAFTTTRSESQSQ
jgi:hypothetical protein